MKNTEFTDIIGKELKVGDTVVWTTKHKESLLMGTIKSMPNIDHHNVEFVMTGRTSIQSIRIEMKVNINSPRLQTFEIPYSNGKFAIITPKEA